ncbi:MAG: BolA/IbaG family iron-sulfur metabolism protein [Betaproteobacteria bacterium]|nr:BolA/IbaG family iron-sulfur metabolism protein [Betaproteobacteria bacterium]
MMHPEEIAAAIRAGMDCEHLRVRGDGRHFEALIVSEEFAGHSRIERQQRVFRELQSRIDSGDLHALSMKTLTSDEWNSSRHG